MSRPQSPMDESVTTLPRPTWSSLTFQSRWLLNFRLSASESRSSVEASLLKVTESRGSFSMLRKI